jgi:hypothetical protein
MKINPVNFLIAILASAILAYALWSLEGSLQNYVAIGAFVFFATTLGMMIGCSPESARRGVNLRVVSGVFFALALIINGLFATIDFSATLYIVICALAFLSYILLANTIYSARQ